MATEAVPMAHGRQVDLTSCADEPIHIPGSIQPHGALLFFQADGHLEGWSANAPALLGLALELGLPWRALALPQPARELLERCSGTPEECEAPTVAAVSMNGADFDCVV